ncbi:hypothetical protein B5K05_01310 [Rhizobium phaseoli]|nr:hypothetical protein B5K04_01305 [Rhizobium phaseoli]RDJ19449.1 hypothetical protein B5K05_01310 [Rhizobium phaseoli]
MATDAATPALSPTAQLTALSRRFGGRRAFVGSWTGKPASSTEALSSTEVRFRQHWAKLALDQSERLNGEIKRRTKIVDIFFRSASVLGMVAHMERRFIEEWQLLAASASRPQH